MVAPADLQVTSIDAASATTEQWALVSQLQKMFADGIVKLREHRLTSRRHADAAPLIVFGALVTRRVGPFNLRREFAAPGRQRIQ